MVSLDFGVVSFTYYIGYASVHVFGEEYHMPEGLLIVFWCMGYLLLYYMILLGVGTLRRYLVNRRLAIFHDLVQPKSPKTPPRHARSSQDSDAFLSGYFGSLRDNPKDQDDPMG